MIRKPNAGQALALTAVSLVALVGFAGLAIDMGVLRYEKHLQQIAADAAALAGANELRDGTSNLPAAAITAGMNASAQNGFADNQASSGSDGSISTCTSYSKSAPVTSSTVLPVCVQINNPPQYGPHKGDSNYVEAYVAADHPTYFMKIFGITNRPVVSRAVATLISQADNPYNPCVVTLGTAIKSHGIGVTANGTPTVYAPSCSVQDSGDFTTNGATVNITASSVYVAGPGTNNNGGGTVQCKSGQDPCPGSSGPISDPFSTMMPPTPQQTPVAFNQNDPVPGTYSSIDISGGNVKFAPGLYMVDGNITINGNANVSTDTTTGIGGVEFYVYGSGAVTIDGTGNVDLSAPNSSPYTYTNGTAAPPGVLFYQDPSDTSAAKIVGTTNSYFQGVLYFPTATLTFGGTAASPGTFNSGAQYTMLVANNVDFSGTATIDLNSNFSGLPTGAPPIENAVLVE